LPITASDSITLSVEHTRQQLFQRFRIGQWTKLAFVGLLAGELGSNGCNRSFFNLPQSPGSTPHPGMPGSLGIDPALLAALGALLAVLLIAGFAFGIIMMYVSSVMRFVLFDSIVTRECNIRWSWSRRLGAGWRFFVWKLLYVLLSLAGFAVVVGIPVAVAISQGWFKEPKEHIAPLVSGGIILFLMFAAFAVITAVVFVFTKDFVVPQMALENIDAMEGWRRLWAMMRFEKGAYAAYVSMKIVLAIVVGLIIGIATLILGLIFVIPSVAIGLLAFLTGRTAGLTWNAQTITLAIVVGCILLGIFLYLVSLISVPAIVFFPAYSMYFFAGRYPQLHAVLYRSSPPAPVPSNAAPASA
jgi:hypothetical protein